MVGEVFPEDAQSVSDSQWLAYAAENGLAGLTKDKKIRYQPSFERAATPVFALADGRLSLDVMIERFHAAREAIWRNAHNGRREFWAVYPDGRIARRFP